VEKNRTSETSKMFIAMNRFKVIKEERKAFEDLWVTRESHLDEVKGFRAFHLLRGPERDDYVLYSSHTIWASQEDFTAWTNGVDQV
jgi:heme-degrading monooxygenase HmoA